MEWSGAIGLAWQPNVSAADMLAPSRLASMGDFPSKTFEAQKDLEVKFQFNSIRPSSASASVPDGSICCGLHVTHILFSNLPRLQLRLEEGVGSVECVSLDLHFSVGDRDLRIESVEVTGPQIT